LFPEVRISPVNAFCHPPTCLTTKQSNHQFELGHKSILNQQSVPPQDDRRRSEYYLLAGNISRCQARLAFIVCVLIVLKGLLTGSARRSIRPEGLIEEAQGNEKGKWHLRAEHEEQSLAGDVRRTEDY
jgi:hypothetical protein